MAAASATNEARWYYDVFLSFRGEDTRGSFTSDLYGALHRMGFIVFMDDEKLEWGDQLSRSFSKAIKESRISIVVLSENYASSSWCLNELLEIIDCMKTKGQLVCPIFYKVDPSDVRKQKSSYGKAMAEHENKFRNDSEVVKNWRSALGEVANLKGFHFKNGDEYQFIERIVGIAATKFHLQQLHVGDPIIGHQSRIEEVKLLLDFGSCDTVCMVGIHGAGGIGKTTLARALYNLIVDQFECAVFIEGVREKSSSYMGMEHLQLAILRKLLKGENIELNSTGEGVSFLKSKLRCRRVLLVLDDVDSEYQLENLAGKCDWFGLGSRVIITTRDIHVLKDFQVEKRYQMKVLNYNDALELFCWKAFKMSQPAPNYEDVSKRAVCYANGLPLALKVIGSNLVKKSVEECECALEQYERIPDRKIQDILKISYDCLPEIAQHVFLDIVFFFKGARQEYVEEILQRCGFFPRFNIGILVDKSLLTVLAGHLQMHDFIQDMGREIVRQQSPLNPGQRSRLYFHKDIFKVLTENLGSDKIEGIILDPPQEEEVEWTGIGFEKMNNLRILIVRNTNFSLPPNYLPNSLRLLDWEDYSGDYLPAGFHLENVVVLKLPQSHLKLEKATSLRKLEYLTRIDFSGNRFITHMPDVSGVPNLRELNLSECDSLIAIDHSVGFLKKLETLDASGCRELRTFLPEICLPSLQRLRIERTAIEFFPEVVGMMDKPLEIRLPKIKKLPPSFAKLRGLTSLWYLDPTCLRDLLTSLFVWLAELRVSNYCDLSEDHIRSIHQICPNLVELTAHASDVEILPYIKEFAKLRVLDLSGCRKLQEITELPSNIQIVGAACCPLSSETSTMLWSQARKEVYKLQVVMPWSPTSQIPDWFDYQCGGQIVSFWARRKFPVVVLALLLNREEAGEISPYFFDLYINGRNVFEYCTESRYACPDIHLIDDNHFLLFDLRCLFNAEDEEWPISDMFCESEWNHIELETDNDDWFTISYWGVYFYKQETNMEDIRFTQPNESDTETSLSEGVESVEEARRCEESRRLEAEGKVSELAVEINSLKTRIKELEEANKNCLSQLLEGFKNCLSQLFVLNPGMRTRGADPFFTTENRVIVRSDASGALLPVDQDADDLPAARLLDASPEDSSSPSP